MCEYAVDCDNVADLRNHEARTAERVQRADLACAWLTFQLAGKQAPSWLVVDRLKAAGRSAMLVPSFVPGATEANTNLVLWRWGPERPHKVDVYDPRGRLPQNQLSWPERVGRANESRPKPHRDQAHEAPDRAAT